MIKLLRQNIVLIIFDFDDKTIATKYCLNYFRFLQGASFSVLYLILLFLTPLHFRCARAWPIFNESGLESGHLMVMDPDPWLDSVHGLLVSEIKDAEKKIIHSLIKLVIYFFWCHYEGHSSSVKTSSSWEHFFSFFFSWLLVSWIRTSTPVLNPQHFLILLCSAPDPQSAWIRINFGQLDPKRQKRATIREIRS